MLWTWKKSNQLNNFPYGSGRWSRKCPLKSKNFTQNNWKEPRFVWWELLERFAVRFIWPLSGTDGHESAAATFRVSFSLSLITSETIVFVLISTIFFRYFSPKIAIVWPFSSKIKNPYVTHIEQQLLSSANFYSNLKQWSHFIGIRLLITWTTSLKYIWCLAC